MGEGRLVEYNFVCIEKDLCNCFMINKPYIENDLDIELTELGLFNHLKSIQVNVPQVSRIYVQFFIVIIWSVYPWYVYVILYDLIERYFRGHLEFY